MKDLATSDSLCKKIACSPFLRVRLVTIYFAKNWKHCNKIIFKYMKNYCSLYFLLFISLKLLFMDNEQCQTRIQEKKKIFLKTRKETKRGRERESKPTLSQYLAIHWNFSYFNLKVIIFYLLLLLLLLFFFFFVRKLCQPKLIIFDSQKSKSPFVKYSNPTQLLQHCSVNASRYDIVGILNTSLYSRGGRKPYTSQSLWRTIL